MRRTAIAITFALCVASVAHADPPTTEERALRHLDAGVAAYRAGEFRRAHDELATANRLVPDRANPYRWLALTEIQLGDCASALRNIDGFLSRVGPDDPRVGEMTRWRDLCSRTGELRIASTPAGATLRLDGSIVGTSPFRSLSMRTGPHELVGEKSGYRPAKRSIVVAAGQALDVHLVLDPAPRPLASRPWFWPVVGGAALAIAGVVVYAATRDSDTLLPPVHCDAGGCRP